MIQTRKDREPLPSGTTVLRLGRKTLNGRLDPFVFQLTTKDKADNPPRLSVWDETLTTPLQAWSFAEYSDKYTCYVTLAVDDIRGITILPTIPVTEPLNVVWHPLMVNAHGIQSPDQRPGTDGHAGITGIETKTKPAAPDKPQREYIRFQLVNISTMHHLPV